MNYVFVYGSLKVGFHNNVVLKKSEKISDFVTSEKYDMFSLGNFPAMSSTNKNYHIAGELYAVDDETLSNLDILEGEGHFYKKKKIFLKGVDFPVWAYFIIDKEIIERWVNNRKGVHQVGETLIWLGK